MSSWVTIEFEVPEGDDPQGWAGEAERWLDRLRVQGAVHLGDRLLSDVVELTVAEAARLADVTPQTVHRWIKDGHLAAVQVGPGAKSPFRIARADLQRVIRHPPRRPPARRSVG